MLISIIIIIITTGSPQSATKQFEYYMYSRHHQFSRGPDTCRQFRCCQLKPKLGKFPPTIYYPQGSYPCVTPIPWGQAKTTDQ